MNTNLPDNSNIDELIKSYVNQFEANGTPIEVSFRKILPQLKTERLTHLIHTYPAKLLLHIPYFFLNNTYFSKRGDTVLDPFCGTGTVLLEAITAGRHAIGADANPLARLIANVKTTSIKPSYLEKQQHLIIRKAKQYRKAEVPAVVNCAYWFSESTQIKLAKLLRSIKTIEDPKTLDFFLVCFSNCVRKVSYADQRISVPVKLNPDRYKKGSLIRKQVSQRLKDLQDIDVFEKFSSICQDNISRMSTMNTLNKSTSKVISDDARNITKNIGATKPLNSNSVDLIITSPPYAGAQKYIRSSSLHLGWLELALPHELAILDKKNIGRESYSRAHYKEIVTGIAAADLVLKTIGSIKPERAAIVGNYLLELMRALDESVRLIKPGGHIIIIIGNNKVCNLEFNTQEYISEYLQTKGLSIVFKLIDDIKSYGLMTKRNQTADIISREWILVFKKQ